jgi:O-antigen/teichoic acid export membrane protein
MATGAEETEPSANLSRRATRAVAWVTMEKILQQVIWLLLFLILAPILGPRVYGLVAMAMIFVGMLELVVIDAASEALLNIAHPEPGHFSTAMTSNLVLGCGFSAGLFLLADPIARSFGEGELAPVIVALAPLTVLGAATAVPIAILKRAIAFRPLAIRSIVGLLVGGAVGIALALSGMGVWSLVGQALAQRVAEVVVLWLSNPQRIGFAWSARHFRELRGFAAHVMVSKSAAFIGGQVPRLIIGIALGPYALGLYTLASRVVEALTQAVIVPQSIVARVTLIGLHSTPSRLVTSYQLALSNVALLAFPIFCGFAAILEPLFRVALDPRWRDAVLPAQILTVSGTAMVFMYLGSALLFARGAARTEARFAALQTVASAVILLIAAPHGLVAAAVGIAVRIVVLLPVGWVILERTAGIRLVDQIRVAGPIFGAAIAMFGAVIAVEAMIDTAIPTLLEIPALMGVGVLVYGGLAFLVAPSGCRVILARARHLWRPGAHAA